MSTTQATGRPFSLLLREYRVAASISQEELAERARLSAKTIGALERGERQSPYRDTIELLSTALGLTAAERSELETAARRRRTRAPNTSPIRGAIAPPPANVPVPNALPLETTCLVGRDRARETVAQLLGSVRLVTLAGPGGIGKTRLAVAVARSVASRFHGGARLVELAAVDDADAVMLSVAAAAGIEVGAGRDPRDALIAGLRGWRGLIVLDNCEHVLGAAARTATALLEGCADVRVLTTSREPLRARGEHVWRVPALSIPADESAEQLDAAESAALFCERARAALPGFALRPGDAAALVSICRRLDGLPLAIELAAARVGTLSLKDLARALDDRFRVLVGGERVAAARHQALHAAIAWSYDLLDPDERNVFCRAAIFVDGFTLDALVEVCAGPDLSEAAIFKALASLIDKSLVVAEIGDAFTRYRMLESTLAFAREMLAAAGEREPIARRHAAFMAAFVRAHAWEMWESPDAQTILEVGAERENVHAALRFCFDEAHDPALGAALTVESAAILRRFDRRAELERRLETLLAAGSELTPAIEAAAKYELLYSMNAAPERQIEAGRRAVELLAQLDAPARHAHAAALLAHALAVCFGRYDEARPLIDAALAFARRSDDLALLDQVLRLASQALPSDAHAERRRAGTDSIALARASGIDRRIADALITAAEVEFAASAFDAALRLGREALVVQRRIANRTGLALHLTNVAAYALAAGDVTAAAAYAREAIPLARAAESRLAFLLALQHLAGVIVARDRDAERAAAILGFVDAHFARAEFIRETTERVGYERDMEAIRRLAGDERAAEARAYGARLSDERAVDEACR